MSAAARLRRLDESATITVLERSGNVSFANCGLPYHVGGVIEERSSLLLQPPAALKDRFNIDVHVGTEAVRIDREAKKVVARNVVSGEEREYPYDSLLLAPGATPVRPPIRSIERALELRNVEDTDAMVAAAGDAKTAVVIGGGFIGLEMAENLLHKGLKVTVVEAMAQVMAPLDPEMVAPVHARLREGGIDLRLSTSVVGIDDNDVELSTGDRVPADLVVASIGVRPDSRLAVEAGLEVGERGGIVVDEQLRTSDQSIYAAGDAVEKVDAIDGAETLVPLTQTANLQGRRVADLIAGREVSDRPVLGTSIVGVLGLQVATTGWNEKRLVAAKRPHRIIHTHPANHAGYYPGTIDTPVDDLRSRMDELPDGELLVHCAVGIRGHIAARILAAHGREARNLDGGYTTWAAGTGG